jgi:hypothetical protein
MLLHLSQKRGLIVEGVFVCMSKTLSTESCTELNKNLRLSHEKLTCFAFSLLVQYK